MQRLILPFARQMMLCGYMIEAYRRNWGYPHYGIDISSIQGEAGDDPTVYASGAGVVLAAGRDNSLGYGVAVLYMGCLDRAGRSSDLVARYMHLRSMCVAPGDRMQAGDKLGVEGKEGTADYHLHLELDTDVENPLYSPQVSRGHSFWRRGTDTTVNPSQYLHIGPGQTLVPPTYAPEWLGEADRSIPELAAVVAAEQGPQDERLAALEAEVRRLKAMLAEREAQRAALRELAQALVEKLG